MAPRCSSHPFDLLVLARGAETEAAGASPRRRQLPSARARGAGCRHELKAEESAGGEEHTAGAEAIGDEERVARVERTGSRREAGP
jgi:hypothetical protein